LALLPFSYVSIYFSDRQLYAADVATGLYHPSAYYLAQTLTSEFPIFARTAHKSLAVMFPIHAPSANRAEPPFCLLPNADQNSEVHISSSTASTCVISVSRFFPFPAFLFLHAVCGLRKMEGKPPAWVPRCVCGSASSFLQCHCTRENGPVRGLLRA
jgi:hypothetical protein